MNRSEQLAASRERLLARGAQQREQLRQQRDSIELRLRGIDRGIGIAQRVVNHPLLIVGAAAAAIAIGPFKILRWVERGAFWWRVARSGLGRIL